MAQQNIDFGAFPDDPSADAIRSAFQKVQENFDETLTGQYIRQLKSDWKVGKSKSVMFKLFGPYEEFLENVA